MKKFLSILLALAVGFTFTFGSAMSAFADDTKPNANENLDKAYQAVLAAVANETFYVDYDTNDTIVNGKVADNNLDAYIFSQTAIKAGVDAAYKQIQAETYVV